MALFTDEEISNSPVKESSYVPTEELQKRHWEELDISPEEYAKFIGENTDSRITVDKVSDRRVVFAVEDNRFISVGARFTGYVTAILRGDYERPEDMKSGCFVFDSRIKTDDDLFVKICNGSYWNKNE